MVFRLAIEIESLKYFRGMDPIESWVDRNELRRMADALLKPPEVAPPSQPEDASFGNDFVGYGAEDAQRVSTPPAKTGPEQNARQALAAARAIAQRGGLLEDPKPPAEASPTAPDTAAELIEVTPVATAAPPTSGPASTPFMARLQAFGNWLREGVQARAFFITDWKGAILIDEAPNPKYHQIARTLAQASRTANRQAGTAAIGNLHAPVAPETVLEVIPVNTRYGPVILGIIVVQPLNSQNAETVARGLQQVIDGGSGTATP